ncbi:DUF4138 domain-containing protein [Flagellimonas abyssi]|uniref:DUF4138 domain-containing protein n=1 Tax=Flagellimonas abyssi TaxID=2864871 RepID=A0ABS7ESQ7_9FLAO|nr:DUF4138 domain-containing protein [Allomuricauda abyssi]MBW8200646.1 DUF4138 domain-containing protein [Allomuricauda abyssi]
MYLKHLYIFIIISTLSIKAFGQRALDTIYANDNKNVALFFPNPVRKAITGHQNFVFTYDRDNEAHYGLLQATPGQESNLLVITSDGSVYSYNLIYSEDISRYTHFIRTDDRIGYAHPMYEAKNQSYQERDSLTQERESYQRISEMLMTQKPGRLAVRRKNGMLFRLEQMVYQGKQVYFVFQISNRSGIDFEVGALELNIILGSHKKRTAYQETPLGISYVYKRPQIVKKGKIKRFVYVVPKFVLADKERLQVSLYELNGSRLLSLQRP